MSSDRAAATAAAELYALPPAEFTAARNAAAKAARDSGEKHTAQRIVRFAKPSASAWAVNQLVRSEAGAVTELIELGEALREAQSGLDRDALRALSADRQKALAALSQRARELGERLGVGMSGSAIVEVGQTLQAAMTDPDAARAVQSGVLVRGLSSTGWEPADLDGALAIPLEGAAPATAPTRSTRGSAPKAGEGTRPRAKPSTKTRSTLPGPSAEELAAERREEQRRQDAEAEAARKEAEELQRRLEKLTERRRAVEAEREALQDQLREVEDELSVIHREQASIRRDARRR